MYLVFSTQNARDTTVPHSAPRFITENPFKALGEARNIMRRADECPFVASVFIFELEPDRPYTLLGNEQKGMLVFHTWDLRGGIEMRERFCQQSFAEKCGVRWIPETQSIE